jgi:multisubunit Na+/H+ antiporter MnhF subunit
MEIVTQIGIGALVIAILASWWRMAKGPTMLDRILAFDAITVCVVGLIVLLSIRWHTLYFLELILVASLLGFLSGVAFVFYLEKTMDSQPNHAPPPTPDRHEPSSTDKP